MTTRASSILIVAAACICAVAALPIACAQPVEHHKMVTGSDLRWEDVPSLPPGAKIAVIEGP